MNHFFSKNFKLFGAGGPQKPDPPPPPVLKPPKLGDLQAISSYEYAESIDLISDGVIDGFVNQRGEYIDDARIFESVYLNDVPIRQPVNIDNNSVIAQYPLSFVSSSVSGLFYPSGFESGFALVSPTGITGISGSLSGISYSFILGRTRIAQDISNVIGNIPATESDNVYGIQYKNLRNKFNYAQSTNLIQNYLLPSLPALKDEGYPFFALKLSYAVPISTGLQFQYSLDTFARVNSDISNYAYIPLEAGQMQEERNIEAPKHINLSYFYSSGEFVAGGVTGDQQVLSGASYLFLSFNNSGNGFVYRNSADALLNYLSGVEIISPNSKFNYGNAAVEIRNGTENQKPLSLFNKTYVDKQYGQILRGPYRKNALIASVPRSGSNNTFINTTFNTGTSSLEASGLLSSSQIYTLPNYEATTGLHPALFNDKAVESDARNVLDGRGNPKFRSWDISADGNYYNVRFSYRNSSEETVQVVVQMEVKKEGQEGQGSRFINKFTYKAGGSRFLFKDTVPILISVNNLNQFSAYPMGFKEKAAMLRAAIEALKNGDGSEDIRIKNVSFSDWNKQYIASVNEKAIPIVHVVNNPNVNQVYVTVGVRVLQDTAEQNLSLVVNNPNKKGTRNIKIDAGNPFPSLVRFKIEAGYQDKSGNEEITWDAGYQIKGFVESQATIDIGREENNANGKSFLDKFNRFILGTKSIATPIQLPEPQAGKVRFVRIERLTAESYSSLVRREISLEKVSEIINVPFSYPFSAVCGLKLDARSLSQIPSRSYDARFKKVFVPSNYFPLRPDGRDKRYISGSELAAFNALPENSLDRVIYQGNWDGTFKLAWTDNPVWLLFDLLVNRRYGLGNFISPDQINYWELYKIGRFCDAVGNDGKFDGVPSSDGGLEPRYGFNGVIADKTNVFEALKSIISSFRGNMFYSNSEINFTNERLKPIMAFFNNANVKDGVFNYNNDRRDLKYNVIEVSFLDRDDLFKEKIEYVEDSDDIKVRGILRTSAQTFGVTSRAHAKRIGQHILYSTINEDQNVAFVAGNEILLCRPGDLISVNDELKTRKRSVGRIIDVNTGAKTLTTNISLSSSDFSSEGLLPEISVLIPTGKYQSSDFIGFAKSTGGLNISSVYQTDTPVTVTLPATGTGVSDSLSPVSYGSVFYIDPAAGGISLFNEIKIGTPCSVTIANTQQDVYKIQSIKELNLSEYEIIASKFDTGKFTEIEASETLDDYFQFYAPSRQTVVNEGAGVSIYNVNKYEITEKVQFTSFVTGNFVGIPGVNYDLSGSWLPVENANAYKVSLFDGSKEVNSQRITQTNVVYNGVFFSNTSISHLQNIRNWTLAVQPYRNDVNPEIFGTEASIGLTVSPPIKNTNLFFRGVGRQK